MVKWFYLLIYLSPMSIQGWQSLYKNNSKETIQYKAKKNIFIQEFTTYKQNNTTSHNHFINNFSINNNIVRINVQSNMKSFDFATSHINKEIWNIVNSKYSQKEKKNNKKSCSFFYFFQMKIN